MNYDTNFRVLDFSKFQYTLCYTHNLVSIHPNSISNPDNTDRIQCLKPLKASNDTSTNDRLIPIYYTNPSKNHTHIEDKIFKFYFKYFHMWFLTII